MAIRIKQTDMDSILGGVGDVAKTISSGVVKNRQQEAAQKYLGNLNDQWIAAGLSQNQADHFGKWLALQPDNEQSAIQLELASGGNIQDIIKRKGVPQGVAPSASVSPTVSNSPATSTPTSTLGTPSAQSALPKGFGIDPSKPIDWTNMLKMLPNPFTGEPNK
jgi:hypothetical protein